MLRDIRVGSFYLDHGNRIPLSFHFAIIVKEIDESDFFQLRFLTRLVEMTVSTLMCKNAGKPDLVGQATKIAP